MCVCACVYVCARAYGGEREREIPKTPSSSSDPIEILAICNMDESDDVISIEEMVRNMLLSTFTEDNLECVEQSNLVRTLANSIYSSVHLSNKQEFFTLFVKEIRKLDEMTSKLSEQRILKQSLE